MALISIINFVNSACEQTNVEQRQRVFQAVLPMDDLCGTTSRVRLLLSLTMRRSITHKIRYLHHYWFSSLENILKRESQFSRYSLQN